MQSLILISQKYYGLIDSNDAELELLLPMEKFKLLILLLLSVLPVALLSSSIQAATIWKDDFSVDLVSELTWDQKKTVGNPVIKDKRFILRLDKSDDKNREEIVTLNSRDLPAHFELHCAVEFTRVEKDKGEFYIKIGNRIELVISFQKEASDKNSDRPDSMKRIMVKDAETGLVLSQTNKKKAVYPHNIESGDRFYITWISNGKKPELQMIKMGDELGEANIADFIIQTNEPVSGNVTIGIRKELKEIRLNFVGAYVPGDNITLVQDWVIF